MTASALQIVPDLLEQARLCYRRSLPVAPTPRAVLVGRARHFAVGVRYSLDHPAAVRRLHAATGPLRDAGPLDGWLSRLLDGAIALSRADLACVQVLDPASGTLRLVAHVGLPDDVVAYFGIVDDDRSACGRAARSGQQVVIPDIARDASFAQHREIAARVGLRSVLSTPLRDYAGHMVGVFSTHWRRPHVPGPDDLQLLRLYADCAGEQLARLLARDPATSAAGPEDPEHPDASGSSASPEVGVIARAMLAALLGPPERPAGDAGGHLEDTTTERLAAVADSIVSDLFAVGLLLDGASSVARDEAVVDRISSASRGVERVIGRIRDLMVTYGEGDPPDQGLG